MESESTVDCSENTEWGGQQAEESIQCAPDFYGQEVARGSISPLGSSIWGSLESVCLQESDWLTGPDCEEYLHSIAIELDQEKDAEERKAQNCPQFTVRDAEDRKAQNHRPQIAVRASAELLSKKLSPPARISAPANLRFSRPWHHPELADGAEAEGSISLETSTGPCYSGSPPNFPPQQVPGPSGAEAEGSISVETSTGPSYTGRPLNFPPQQVPERPVRQMMPCDICSKSFKGPGALKQHKTKMHNIDYRSRVLYHPPPGPIDLRVPFHPQFRIPSSGAVDNSRVPFHPLIGIPSSGANDNSRVPFHPLLGIPSSGANDNSRVPFHPLLGIPSSGANDNSIVPYDPLLGIPSPGARHDFSHPLPFQPPPEANHVNTQQWHSDVIYRKAKECIMQADREGKECITPGNWNSFMREVQFSVADEENGIRTTLSYSSRWPNVGGSMFFTSQLPGDRMSSPVLRTPSRSRRRLRTDTTTPSPDSIITEPGPSMPNPSFSNQNKFNLLLRMQRLYFLQAELLRLQGHQYPSVLASSNHHNFFGQGINDKSRGSTVTDFTDSLSPPSARHSLVHEGLTTSHCPDSGASGPRVPLPSHVLGSVKSSDTDHLEPSTCWPHSNPSQYSLSPSSVDRPELPVDLQGDLASESLNLSLRSNPNTNKQIDPGIIDLSTAPPSNTTTIRKVNLNTQLCPKRKRDFASKCARESTHKNDQHNMKLFLERGSYSSQPADDVWECPTQHNVQSSKEESKESSSIFNVNDHNKEITEDIDVLSSEITPGEDTSLNINIANLGRIEKSQHGDTNGIKSSHKETESSEKEISSDLNVLSSAISEDASHGKEVTEEDISCPCPPRCFQNLNPTTTPNLSVEKSSSEVIYVPSSSAMSDDQTLHLPRDSEVSSVDFTVLNTTSANLSPKETNLPQNVDDQGGELCGLKLCKETESSEKAISSDLNVLSSAISEDASHGKEVTEEDISCPCPPRCFQNLNPTTTPNLSVEKSSSEVIYVPSSSAMSDDQTLHLPRDSEVSSVDFTVLNTTSANLSPKETNLPQNVEDQGGELCGLKLRKETESSEKAISSDLNVLSSAISEDASHGKEVTEEDISCPCPPRCFQNLNPTTTPNLSVEKISSEVIYVPSSSAMSDDQTLHLPRDSEVSSGDPTVLNPTSANLSPKETNLPQNVEDQGGELCGLKLPKQTESSEKAISSDLNVLSSAISEDASHGKEVTEEDISCPCPPRCFQDLNSNTKDNLSVENISAEMVSAALTLHLTECSEINSGNKSSLNTSIANLEQLKRGRPKKKQSLCGYLSNLKLSKNTETSEDKNSTRNLRSASTKNASQKMTYNLPKCEVRLPAIRTLSHLKKIMNENGVTIVPAEFYNKLAHKEVGSSVDNGRFKKDNILGRTKDDTSLHVRSSLKRKIIEPIENPNKRQQLDLAETSSSHGTKHVQFSEGTAMGQDNNPVQPKCKRIRKRSSIQKLTTTQRFTIDRMRNDRIATWYSEAVKPTLVHQNVELNPDPFEAEKSPDLNQALAILKNLTQVTKTMTPTAPPVSEIPRAGIDPRTGKPCSCTFNDYSTECTGCKQYYDGILKAYRFQSLISHTSDGLAFALAPTDLKYNHNNLYIPTTSKVKRKKRRALIGRRKAGDKSAEQLESMPSTSNQKDPSERMPVRCLRRRKCKTRSLGFYNIRRMLDESTCPESGSSSDDDDHNRNSSGRGT